MSNTKTIFLAAVPILIFALAGTRADAQSASGQARLVAILNTTIASETPGIVRYIDVKPGESVAEQNVLIRLNEETFTAEHDVAAAESEIARLEAQNRVNIDYAIKSAEVALSILKRSQQANRSFAKAVPATEIEKLRLEWEQALLSGKQAEMEFDIAQWAEKLKLRKQQAAKVRLDGRKVLAPYSGTIAQIYVQPGQWVNAGEPIVRLMDSSRLRAEAYLHEDLIRQVSVGQAASFEYTLANETVQVPATVTFVGVEIVEGIFQVWADFENPEGLHVPGIEGRLVLQNLADTRLKTEIAVETSETQTATQSESASQNR